MIRTIPAFLLVISVAACGSDGGSDGDETTATTSATSSEPAAKPACADVWKEGATLPADYDGCNATETETAGPVETCDNGTDRYATYTVEAVDDPELGLYDLVNPHFALLGGKIIAYTFGDGADLKRAYSDCHAG